MGEDKNPKQAIRSQFGKNAKNYVSSEIHAKGQDLAKLIEIIHCNGKEHVLDIATGGGHVANALAPLTEKVTALDLTAEVIAAAKAFVTSNGHHNVEFVEGDAEQLPFPEEAFDKITCRIAAHHFSDITAFVEEAFRTLKKEGEFLLIDNVAPERDDFDQFYNKVEKKRDYSHQRAWKKSEWLYTIEKQGFELEEMYRFEKPFLFDAWCKNMNVSEDNRQQLSDFMLQSSNEHQRKFKIKREGEKVQRFQGESILLKAKKPS